MCVCMHVYECVYESNAADAYVCVCTYACGRGWLSAFVFMYVCVFMVLYACVCTYACRCVRVCACVCVHACVHTLLLVVNLYMP